MYLGAGPRPRRGHRLVRGATDRRTREPFGQVFQLVPPGDADHDAADFDRRLGRPRGHHGARLRICRPDELMKASTFSLLFGAVYFIAGAFGGLVWILER